MKRKVFFYIGLIALFCYLYGFQDQKEFVRQEKSKADDRSVFVDVVVTKDGEFVADLIKDDFELSMDGKKVFIDSVKLVDIQEREISDRSNKLAVIFHDVHFWPKDASQRTEEIVDELASLVKQGMELMVLQLSWTEGLEVLQPFTANEETLRKAAQKAVENIGIDKSFDDLWLDRPRNREEETLAGWEESLEKGVLQAYLNIERKRFEKAIGGILGACNMMKSFQGRKSILLISDGLPDLSSFNPETIKRKSGGKETLDAIHLRDRGQLGRIRVFDPFNIMEKENFERGEEVIRELIHFANTQNVSIYTLEPGTFSSSLFSGTSAEYSKRDDMDLLSFRSEEKRRRVQNLGLLAEETNAVSFIGAKKFERFHQVMSTDLNYYYQLKFFLKKKEADNKYHRLEVKVNRADIEVRYRKGYRDYLKNEVKKMLLVSAFYNPVLFKELPFEAEFIPFFIDTGKYEPWMNIALPAKEIFLDRFVEDTSKTFNLYIWLTDTKGREKGFRGEINIPLNINSSFMEFVKARGYLSIHFKGPELSLGQSEYQAVFALFDPQTDELGTWQGFFSLPELKKSKEGAIINCVLGSISSNPKEEKKSFSISKQDGSLDGGRIKFFPEVTNRFSQWRNANLFLQVYLPRGKEDIHPRFHVSGEGNFSDYVSAELISEHWNKKSKAWSGLFELDIRTVPFGESSLRAEIPISGKVSLESKEVKLIRFRH